MRHHFLMAQVASLFSLVMLSQALFAGAGSLSRDFKVTNSGGVSYQIPLEVPPGTAAMQPDLSFAYSNQASFGLLGKGWNLTGLSFISRCPKNLAQDGEIREVSFDGGDRFCYQGERLIAVQGAYGAHGTEYRTERESWTRIQSEGDCGGSPCSFTVTTRAGLTLEFARTENARIIYEGMGQRVYLWALNRVTDKNGNYWTVDYLRQSHSFYPSTIRYTGNDQAGLSFHRQIRFNYQMTNIPIETWRSGVRQVNQNILQSVETFVEGQLVKRYRTEYEVSTSSRRELLKRVWECDASQRCLLLANLSYNTPSPGFDSSSMQVPGPVFRNELGGWKVKSEGILRDLNGDSVVDFSPSTCTETQCFNQVQIGNRTGFQAAGFSMVGTMFRNQANDFGSKADGVLLDLNGDGYLDYSPATCNKGEGCAVDVYHGGPNGFHNAGYTLPGGIYFTERDKFVAKTIGILQDLNGDGIADYSPASCNDKGECSLQVYPGTGRGFGAPAFNLPGHLFYIEKDGLNGRTEGILNDFNGDGLVDYSRAACYDKAERGCDLRVFHNTGAGFIDAGYSLPGSVFLISADGYQAKSQGVVTDFNGDGIADYSSATCFSNGSSDTCDYRIFYGTGRGFYLTPYQLPGKIFHTKSVGFEEKIEGVLQDINGDGLVDFSRGTCWVDESFGAETCDLKVFHGTGSGFVDAGYNLPQKLFHNQNNEWNFKTEGLLQDFNGDGSPDYSRATCWTNGGCSLGISLNRSVHIDSLIGISNRLAGSISIQYEPMTSSALYRKGTASVFPMIDVQAPMFLVKEYTLNDGRSQAYRLGYRYYEARVHGQGRGWMGFRSVEEINYNAQLMTTQFYLQNFPLHGLLERIEQRDFQGRTLKVSRYSYQEFPHLPSIRRLERTQQRDDVYLSGSYDFTQGKDFQYDAFGNITLTFDRGDIQNPQDDIIECSQYANDGQRWLLGYPQLRKVTTEIQSCSDLSRFQGPSDQRLTRYEWDANFRLLSEARYRDSDQTWIPIRYAYDDFGNRIETEFALGSIWKVEYDEKTHTFPIKTRSPANQSGQSLIEESSYSLAFGTIERQIDANGQIFAFDYDSFGRLIGRRAPNPTGTLTLTEAWDYAPCFNSLSCPAGRTITSYTRPDWDSQDVSQWPFKRTYYDGLGREYLTQTQAGDEGQLVIEVRKEYDAQGRMARQSLPHFVGEAVPWQSVTYDLHNRPLTTTNALGASEHRCYALGADRFTLQDVCDTAQQANPIDTQIPSRPFDGVTGANRQVLSMGPDPRLIDEASDQQVLKALYTVNSDGRLIRQQAADGSEARYTYNRLGQVESSTDPNQAKTFYFYDSTGQLTKLVDPTRGTIIFVFDRQQRMIERIEGNGVRTVFTYDALDRVIRKDVFGSGLRASERKAVLYGYDDSKLPHTNGRLAWVAWQEYDSVERSMMNYRKAFAYDRLGRLQVSQFVIESLDKKLHYLGKLRRQAFISMRNFLPNGQINEHVYPDGSRLKYTYNRSLQLQRIELLEADASAQLKPTQTVASFHDYDALGRSTRIIYGNGVETIRDFDAQGRMLQDKTVLANGQLADLRTYHWNKANKLFAIDDGRDARWNQDFVYDVRGRMIQAAGIYGDKSYQYDSSGNLLQSGAFRYQYDPQKPHQIKSVWDSSNKLIGTFEYDANGNVISQPDLEDAGKPKIRRWFYLYDLDGRLVEVRKGFNLQTSKLSNRFSYDPFGQRTKKVTQDGGTSLYVAGDYEIAFFRGRHQVHTKNVSDQEGVLAAITERYETDELIPAFSIQNDKVLSQALHWTSLEGFLARLAEILRDIGSILSSLLPRVVLSLLLLSAICGMTLIMGHQVGMRMALRARWRRALIGYPLALSIALAGQPMAAMAALNPETSGQGCEPGIRFLHKNHQSSVTTVSDEFGDLIARVAYEPFGKIFAPASEGRDIFRQKYSSHEFDSESGLYYFGSRYYDPQTGRFLSPDPAWQYHSPYIFGDNDPLAGRDSDGEFFWFIFIGIAIGAAVGGYFGGVAANGGNFNPAQWDWTSGKTWAGIFVGAFIGGLSGGVGAGLASTGAGIGAVMLAEATLGALDGLIMGAINGQTGLELFTSVLIGFAGGAAFGGALAGAGKAAGQAFKSLRSIKPEVPSESLDDIRVLTRAGLEPRQIRQGTDPHKIAIIGRSMGGRPGQIGVREAAKALESQGQRAFTFEPSEKVWQEFMQRVNQHRSEIGDPDALLPDELVRKTSLYAENQAWAQVLIRDGYTVYDIGDPNRLGLDTSAFYGMELDTLFSNSWSP